MAGLRLQHRHRPTRTGQARRVALLVTATAAALPFAGLLPPGLASARTKPIQAMQLRLPVNASSNAQGQLFGAGCARAGTCTAGGTYIDRAGHSQAMVVAESGGRWARALELRLPRNADPDPFASVNSVACPRAAHCVAAGAYGHAGRFQAFVATQSHGRWQSAHSITLPPNSARLSQAGLSGVACTGVGSCVAVGDYRDRSESFHPLAVVESKGRWGRAFELPLPKNAGPIPDAFFTSVACVRLGSCVAAGGYVDKLGVAQAAIVTESAGRCCTATQIKLPPGASASPAAYIKSVTCAGARFCIVVGGYRDTSEGFDSFAATRSARGWARAVRITVHPANASVNTNTFPFSIACTRAGFCVESAQYIDKANGFASMAAFESRGKWTRASEIKMPANMAAGAAMNSVPNAVSCTSTGYCLVVGDYRAKSGLLKPMAAKLPAP